MTKKQKEIILPLLRKQDEERNYLERYLVEYKEFLNVADMFTDFCCERAEGKEQYSAMIEEIIKRDNAAKIFVEVYGFEEEADGTDIFIYSETLIIFTVLPDEQIQEVIDMSGDIFPSDFGEANQDNSQMNEAFVVDAEGKLNSVIQYCEEKRRMLYFWWD